MNVMPLSARCVPYSQQACADAVTNLGLNFGGAGHNFAGNYDKKGCYSYNSDTSYGKDKITYYGTGGSGEQIKGSKHLDSTKYRPAGYDCSNGKLEPCNGKPQLECIYICSKNHFND